MSEISKAIDVFLRDNLNPKMKAEGFTKFRRHYHRTYLDRIKKLRIESPKFNQFGVGYITVGLSIYIPGVAEVLGLAVHAGYPQGFESGIHVDLGFLLPEKRQEMWEISVEKDNESEARRFNNAIQSFAIPWYYKMREEQKLLSFLESEGNMKIASIICALKNNFEEAEQYLDSIKKNEAKIVEHESNIAKITKHNLLTTDAILNFLKGNKAESRKIVSEIIIQFPNTEAYWKKWLKSHGI